MRRTNDARRSTGFIYYSGNFLPSHSRCRPLESGDFRLPKPSSFSIGIFLPRSQPGIYWFAFKCENAKDRFMHSTQRFFANKSFKSFNAQSKFSQSQRSLRGEATCAKSFEVFRRRVFRAIDDAEILTTTTLHSKLR